MKDQLPGMVRPMFVSLSNSTEYCLCVLQLHWRFSKTPNELDNLPNFSALHNCKSFALRENTGKYFAVQFY